MDTADLRELRAILATACHLLHQALDAIDGDPDLEDGDPPEPGGDEEPWLGSPEGFIDQRGWSWGGDRDLELDWGDYDEPGRIEGGQGL